MNGITVRGCAIPADELSWRFSRSSGPGGQSVNTTDSRVELSFDLRSTAALPSHLHDRALSRLSGRLVDGVLTISASEYRSQHRNREAARARLVDVLGEALKPPAPKRQPTKPSRGARERRLAGKKRRSQTKAMRRRPVD
jgi:ribosome-associated protein